MKDKEFDRVYALGMRAGWNAGYTYGCLTTKADQFHISREQAKRLRQQASAIAHRYTCHPHKEG